MNGNAEANMLQEAGDQIKNKMDQMAEFVVKASGELEIANLRIHEQNKTIHAYEKEVKFLNDRLIEIEKMADHYRFRVLELEMHFKSAARTLVSVLQEHEKKVSEYAPKSETERKLNGAFDTEESFTKDTEPHNWPTVVRSK